jgi:hypothetical protein
MDAFAFDCILILKNMKFKDQQSKEKVSVARDSNGFNPHSTNNSGGKFPQIGAMK